ncbi:MAG: F0F1 ATP synthase subunit B [Candidatus Margulisiibacteriota bacterium]
MVDINIYEIVLQIINFLAVLFILKKFLYGPVMDFMNKRQNTIANELKQSKKDRTEAADILEEQRKLLMESRKEAQIIREKAEQIAVGEKQTIVSKAHQEAESIIENTKNEIKKEVEAAKIELTKQIGQLAVNVATHVLQKEVNPKLVDEYVVELQSKNKA